MPNKPCLRIRFGIAWRRKRDLPFSDRWRDKPAFSRKLVRPIACSERMPQGGISEGHARFLCQALVPKYRKRQPLSGCLMLGGERGICLSAIVGEISPSFPENSFARSRAASVCRRAALARVLSSFPAGELSS